MPLANEFHKQYCNQINQKYYTHLSVQASLSFPIKKQVQNSLRVSNSFVHRLYGLHPLIYSQNNLLQIVHDTLL